MFETLPRLEPRCGSWICTSPTGHVVETFMKPKAQQALDAGWKVQTAQQYLAGLNARNTSKPSTP
ncbi:hypothetical protein [Henriciella sp.]|uniref:hypothetical protein n=1 Tax=Henriciella sp. TaxID=1968823 RepID=UPI002603D254|nr:hypothetical protein [Henriciella sp.]